jgi:hypothetical protein
MMSTAAVATTKLMAAAVKGASRSVRRWALMAACTGRPAPASSPETASSGRVAVAARVLGATAPVKR